MRTYLLEITEYDDTRFYITITRGGCEKPLTKDAIADACEISPYSIDYFRVIATGEEAERLWEKYQLFLNLKEELRQAGFGIRRSSRG